MRGCVVREAGEGGIRGGRAGGRMGGKPGWERVTV